MLERDETPEQKEERLERELMKRLGKSARPTLDRYNAMARQRDWTPEQRNAGKIVADGKPCSRCGGRARYLMGRGACVKCCTKEAMP